MSTTTTWCLDYTVTSADQLAKARRTLALLIEEMDLRYFEIEWHEGADSMEGAAAMTQQMALSHAASKHTFVEVSDPDSEELEWLVRFAPHSFYGKAGRDSSWLRPGEIYDAYLLCVTLTPAERSRVLAKLADAGIEMRLGAKRTGWLRRWW